MVLCPTRELADQVAKDLRALARFIPNLKLLTLCGGIPLRPQLASLEIPPDVVVGTPGRVLELVETDALSLAGIQTFVLDEEMRKRITDANPDAALGIAQRLLEANDRGYWQPDDATLEALRDAAADLEDRLEGVYAA